MGTVVSEHLIEWAVIAVYALASIAFSAAGIFIELAAIENLTSDQLTVGLWEAGAGVFLLVIGVYLFGYLRVWKRIRSRGADVGGQ